MRTPERHRQVGDLFHQALELAPDQRPGFLEQECAGDASLLAELQALLAEHDRSDDFLEAPAIELAARSLAEEGAVGLVGRELGPYRVEALVGVGGMGEVYRAHDTRLGRSVALKVLPSHLAADPERRRRLEREARAISQLNHPHVCTLYDVGQHEGIDFLVMEYLEGQTLAARLARGPIPLDEGLRFAIEIADALDRAHRQGLVHRDLKPANIMLTRTGTKLLDFGLARFSARSAPTIATVSGGATEQDPVTAKGTILGTVHYMAPEQLEGTEPDRRTDIFAFGAVVYEMASAHKAFDGKSHASLISAIMTYDPPAISTLHPQAPAALDHVLKRCLAKNPEERWQSFVDVREELRWIAESGSQPGTLAPASPAPRARDWRPWTIAAVALVAALALVLRNSCRQTSVNEAPASLPTVAGWPTHRTSPDEARSMFDPSLPLTTGPRSP